MGRDIKELLGLRPVLERRPARYRYRPDVLLPSLGVGQYPAFGRNRLMVGSPDR